MHVIKTPIYQTKEIREFEQLVQERFAITGQMLMQRAGKAAFDYLLRRWPHAQHIAVFCGSGNNGGDGYVVAELAKERGLKVTIWQIGDVDKMKEEAKHALNVCRQANIPIYTYSDKEDLHHPDLIVDAICGIGLTTHLRDNVVSTIERIQRQQVPIFSLDIPTGICADTGLVLGNAVRATATMTFIGLKLGLLTGSGTAYAGELVYNDLQLPAELFSYVEPVAEKIHLSSYHAYLKARPRDWHKGLSGHVLIVGGDVGFAGAVCMAAIAALRVGAGLVTIATHPAHAVMMNVKYPEVMCHGVETAEQLKPLLAKADMVVLGPGLGQSDWAKALWQCVCAHELPLVVDGDGLNILSETKMVKDNWVLTPHPGEAGRLLKQTTVALQQDRLEAVKEISKRYCESMDGSPLSRG